MSARILPHPDLRSCALCGKLTSALEASRRKFWTHKCGDCGGALLTVEAPKREPIVV